MAELGTRDVSRALREQYEKGCMAIQRNNLDYAIDILTAVLKQEPGFFECREALRAAQFKRAGKKGGFFKRLFGTASGSPLLAKAQVQLRTNPREAIATAEQILSGDPYSIGTHRLLAEAALNVGLPRTAVLSLEIAFKHAPDRDVVLRLGEALAEAGEITRAESVLGDLAKTFPADVTVQQAFKNICAKRSLREGYEDLEGGGGSYRDVLKDQDEASALEQAKREVKSSEVTARMLADYETRLADEPNNLRLLRSMAELCADAKDFDRALGYYQRIMESEGGAEPALEREIIRTRCRRFDQELGQLDRETPDYEEQVARLRQQRQEYELGEWKRLADRYPTDLPVRFEYGKRLVAADRLNEAIQELQKAQANPHLRTRVLLLLGHCFARRGIHDLAVRTFQNALKEKAVFDEEKKELLYALGEALETMGKGEEAIEPFKQIYEVDIDFKDVARKIDDYYAKR